MQERASDGISICAVTVCRELIIGAEGTRGSGIRHAADVIFGIAMLSVAIAAIVRPVIIVRWAKRAHSQLEEDDQIILWIARLIGVGGLCVAAFFWLIIIRSF